MDFNLLESKKGSKWNFFYLQIYFIFFFLEQVNLNFVRSKKILLFTTDPLKKIECSETRIELKNMA